VYEIYIFLEVDLYRSSSSEDHLGYADSLEATEIIGEQENIKFI